MLNFQTRAVLLATRWVARLLLLASIIDPQRVSALLALDPVDMNPVEFSNEKGSNLPLSEDTKGKEKRRIPIILLTCTDGGRGYPNLTTQRPYINYTRLQLLLTTMLMRGTWHIVIMGGGG